MNGRTRTVFLAACHIILGGQKVFLNYSTVTASVGIGENKIFWVEMEVLRAIYTKQTRHGVEFSLIFSWGNRIKHVLPFSVKTVPAINCVNFRRNVQLKLIKIKPKYTKKSVSCLQMLFERKLEMH